MFCMTGTALQPMSDGVDKDSSSCQHDVTVGIVKPSAIAEAQSCFRAADFAQLPLACLQ